MQYQTKWMRIMLKRFASWPSSLVRTLLVAGLLIGCLGIAFASLQQSLLNADATPANAKAPAVSIKISSHIDRLIVTYTLTMRSATHAGTIHSGVPITLMDILPQGLSNISANGNHWNTQVSFKNTRFVVFGTYKGNYPIAPGATLPIVTIRGTITRDANNVITDTALVNVPGNTDKAHGQAVINNNIESILDSDNSACDSSCSNHNNNDCDSSCSNHNNNDCDSSCSNHNNNDCDSNCNSQNNSDCNNSCDDQGNKPCDSACDQQGIHTAVSQHIHQSVDTSCECTGDGSVSTPIPTNTTSDDGKHDPTGKGSISPFPAMPNTGSDPS